MLKANDFDRDGCRTFIVQFLCRKMETFLFARIISEKIASSETLKVVSATFLLVYFVCLKGSTHETRKNVFYFTSKALFVLEIIKF